MHDFPGVYSYRAIHEYEIESRIGLGGLLGFDGGGLGRHGIDFSAFAEDTTIFSNGEQRLRKRDGGVSNTGDLSSFAFSLGGGDFFPLKEGFFADWLSGFSYRLGYARQAQGVGNETDEGRFSFSAQGIYQLTENLSVRSVNEYVRIKNLEGHSGHDRSHYTSAVGFDWKLWTFACSASLTGNKGASEPDENLDGSAFSFSLSRKIGNAKIGAGYRRVKEEGEHTGRIGVLLSFDGGFSSLAPGASHDGHVH